MFKVLRSLCLGLAASCPLVAMAAPHVVVISIDGLPAYLLDDPRASLPVIRGLARGGASSSTGMRVSNPSVTWPNHTTLMTGVHPERHGVLFNGLLERGGEGKAVRVNPAKSQQELVRVPLLFDRLREAGLTSAAINWPCTRGSTSIDDNMPDVPEELRYTTPRLKDELEGAGYLPRFTKGGQVARDEVWAEAACRVIRARKPSLLTLHLLNLDSTHHGHAPLSVPGYTAAALADAMVGRVLEALDDAGIRDETTVFVVADHGFAADPKTLQPNVVLRREGLIAVDKGQITAARVHTVPEGGIAMVYLTDPATATEDRATVRRLFAGAEGIAAILEADDFPRYHLPRPEANPGMADMILAAKDGYGFSGTTAGESLVEAKTRPAGAHGYLSTEPKMNAIFVASGARIRPGTSLGTIDNTDLAPTVARLLDVSLEQASGRVLSEILEAGR
jgi:predicted AlkP superfamily pyrophosphatase or phosphodiesterase